jgi:hypothetical protein
VSTETVPREVIYFPGGDIPQELLDDVCRWVAALGADPKRVLAQFRILATDAGYQLHLSRKVQRNGHDVIDQALNKVWSEPLIIDLGSERTWPKWLHDAQGPDTGIWTRTPA